MSICIFQILQKEYGLEIEIEKPEDSITIY